VHYRTRSSTCFSQPVFLRLIAVSLLFCGTAAAQSSGGGLDDEHRVAAGHDGPLHAAVRRETSWLAYGTRSDHQPVTKPGPNWFVRHPVMTGTLIGAGAGLVLSRVDAIGGVSHDPRVGVIGAAIGAWVGLISSAAQTSRAGHKVGAGTKIGIAAGAVGLIVLPVVTCYGAGGCGGSS